MTYFLVVLVAVGGLLLLFHVLEIVSKRRNRLTPFQVADIIEKHIDGSDGPYDWDYFTSVPIADPRLDAIRLRCIKTDYVLPEQRNRELKKIIQDLRS